MQDDVTHRPTHSPENALLPNEASCTGCRQTCCRAHSLLNHDNTVKGLLDHPDDAQEEVIRADSKR